MTLSVPVGEVTQGRTAASTLTNVSVLLVRTMEHAMMKLTATLVVALMASVEYTAKGILMTVWVTVALTVPPAGMGLTATIVTVLLGSGEGSVNLKWTSASPFHVIMVELVTIRYLAMSVLLRINALYNTLLSVYKRFSRITNFQTLKHTPQ